MDIEITAARQEDMTWIQGALTRSWGSTIIVVNGEAIDAMDAQCWVAQPERGLLVFRDVPGNGIEIVAIEAFVTGAGIARVLLDHLTAYAKQRGCLFLSATTTNDNLAALRFYQRLGFRMSGLRAGAVTRARETLKPTIPLTGYEGIPIRDEIELRFAI